MPGEQGREIRQHFAQFKEDVIKLLRAQALQGWSHSRRHDEGQSQLTLMSAASTGCAGEAFVPHLQVSELTPGRC